MTDMTQNAPQHGANKVPSAGKGALSQVMGALNAPAKAAQITTGLMTGMSAGKNAVKNNPYYDKLAEEKDESTEKAKKKSKNLGKYIPHLVGATLLTAAAARAIQTGDITQPFQDVRDGAKRIPAHILNTFKKHKGGIKAKPEVVKGAVKGAADGVKATKGAPAAKINNSFLSNAVIGFARGTGQVVPYLAGAAYLDHKVKDANEKAKKQEGLKVMHAVNEPLAVSAARTAKHVSDQTKEQQKTASVLDDVKKINWKENGKDMVVDAVRESVPKALAAAMPIALAISGVKKLSRTGAKRINDTADEYLAEIQRKKKQQERDNSMQKEAAVLHPKDRTDLERNIRNLILVGTTAAATLPAAVGTEAISRRIRNKKRQKQEYAKSIERKYRALQRKQQLGGNVNGEPGHGINPNRSTANSPAEHDVQSEGR